MKQGQCCTKKRKRNITEHDWEGYGKKRGNFLMEAQDIRNALTIWNDSKVPVEGTMKGYFEVDFEKEGYSIEWRTWSEPMRQIEEVKREVTPEHARFILTLLIFTFSTYYP